MKVFCHALVRREDNVLIVIIFHLVAISLLLGCFHSSNFENMMEMLELVRKALCGSITHSTVFTMPKQFGLLDQCLLTIQNNFLLKAPFLSFFQAALF